MNGESGIRLLLSLTGPIGEDIMVFGHGVEDSSVKAPKGAETGGTRCPTLEALPLSLLNDFLYCPRWSASKAGNCLGNRL